MAAQNLEAEIAVKLWEVDIIPAAGYPDRIGQQIAADAADLGIAETVQIKSAYGYLIQGRLDESQVETICQILLVDTVVERHVVGQPGQESMTLSADESEILVQVMPKPGVTDAEADSACRAIEQMGFDVEAVQTLRKYWIAGVDQTTVQLLAERLLSNDSIENFVVGPLAVDRIERGSEYVFDLRHVDVLNADEDQLQAISKQWQLSLTLVEMQTIQDHFRSIDRNPTDVELETIAQTWSEHCSHKTLAGRIEYTDENGTRQFDNMLKETIFAATQKIRAELGQQDWCVSVFKDNAGIIRFDDQYNLAFKVETHNRPSALEPYGGANTGIGGVIRDTLGTGLGAKPICNTDVFCFADPDTPVENIPTGVLHPRRVMKGVVAGVRDYGNRMGIPTVNGAVYFDPRYIGNPLVFCGNVGLIRRDRCEKEPRPGDLIVSIGGRTGRDGIHGATFSSAELTDTSEQDSGGAVQIGNAITEKMLMDVLLQASDENLFTAVTDCGAGGFSSAVGEMAEEIGAEVWLEKAPLKYRGLSYTEIWISEAQERMVCALPPENWDRLYEICSSESVEATVIGKFLPTGRLHLLYDGNEVADLDLKFLHDGRPPVIRQAKFQPVEQSSEPSKYDGIDLESSLHQILGSANVASKHWIIRQYDHEVQGGSVIKPLVGIENDGPGDAAVLRPVLSSRRGLVVSCGMNPHFGDFDPYHMAMSAIDEAIRNCVAVGGDPSQIAILDNFCWGYTDRPETLGALVRAALGCFDLATVLKTPFISGKDSLNNEFTYQANGQSKTISIPSTLLISALGQVADVARCVTMDLKAPGNQLYLVGRTAEHLGGSHLNLVHQIQPGGSVPTVDPPFAKEIFRSLHAAIDDGLVRACHDLSEGGLAVALAEMAFAGGLGLDADIDGLPIDGPISEIDLNLVRLFSESNSRFICEVTPENQSKFEAKVANVPTMRLGSVSNESRFRIRCDQDTLIDCDIQALKQSWIQRLDWN